MLTLEKLSLDQIIAKINSGDFVAVYPEISEYDYVHSLIKELDNIPLTRPQYLEKKKEVKDAALKEYAVMWKDSEDKQFVLLSSLFTLLYQALELEYNKEAYEVVESYFWKLVTQYRNGACIEDQQYIANYFIYLNS